MGTDEEASREEGHPEGEARQRADDGHSQLVTRCFWHGVNL
jgi:hypothetical protein